MKVALNESLEKLKIHYQILLHHQRLTANAAALSTTDNKKLTKILSLAKTASKEEKSILRDQLYNLLKRKYQLLKQKGVLQYQFVLPNNESFLRMHKPNKFGDDLTNIREDFNYTNKTKKASKGFVQGRTAHGFRNVYPIFDKSNNTYLGLVEISFSSDNLQKYLLEVSKIETHFLVNKKIFDVKIWPRDDVVLKYIQSSEHKNYMFAMTSQHSYNQCVIENGEKLKPIREEINKGITKGEKFATYTYHHNHIDVISFYPIKSFNDTKTVAWLVSYEGSEFLYTTLKDSITIRVISFFIFLLLWYFIYRILNQKEILDKEIKVKTKELQSLNDTLEEKIAIRTKEQDQLLLLFNKGEESLFKWKNDENWSAEYVSDNVTEIFGYTKDEFLNGDILYANLINKDDLLVVTDEINQAIKQDKTFFTHKPYRILSKENKTKWLLDNTIIIKDDDGKIINFLGYISEITELMEYRYNLEELIKEKTKENLKQLEILQEQTKLASMGEMIGAIAHQWRQPLSAVNMSIQNLDEYYEDGLLDKEFIDKFIEKNKKTIKFMSKTIDDFRNFYRIDKTKRIFSVKEAIEETISIQSAQLKDHDIKLSLSGEDFTINAYKSEFQQVILNLISNAKDALDELNVQSAKIDIELEDKTIFIEDNGGGIPNDIISRIFEPYFTTKEQGKGTGMGLYMSKMIIKDNLGGTIKVENTENGARFTIGFKHG
ncbi:MAG: ATP-binding protein [Campylobacterota bacterium]|nr:ATP-binding protein [Campylobacterota bacterium]